MIDKKSTADDVREDETTTRLPPPSENDLRMEAPASPANKKRGALFAFIGAIALVLQLASSKQVPHGALLGAASTFVFAFGLLECLGLLRRREDDVALSSSVFGPLPGESVYTAPMYTLPIAALIAIAGCFASQGSDLGIAITLLLALAVAGLSAIHRPELIPLLLLTMIGLPRLGAFALWDPWETHYGEVAREILSRDDWISLWWAQDGWFWSKPILIFWAEAWSMSALGVSALPDAHPAHAEWALRLPTFVMSLGAIAAIQALTRRAFGARAGILAALVVGTMPHFYLLAHQAITDMPLTAALSVSICMLGFALLEKGETRAPGLRMGPFGVTSKSLVTFVLLVLTLPQLVYLATRNLSFYPDRFAFAVGRDLFLEGSAGNHGVAGNALTQVVGPVFSQPQPVVQALIFSLLLALVLYLMGRVDSRRSTAMHAFYIACAFGLLGKGIPGVALPGLVALFYLIASRRFSLLTKNELEIPTGIAIVSLIGLPWYVAMYIRHGRPFIDRILIHDHINRLASGVHGDNGAIDYFLAQLGYGTLPYAGLVPIAVLAFVFIVAEKGLSKDSPDPRQTVTVLIGLWAMAAFTLFNAMATKFHHYIFPVVPAAGMLVGVVLDRALPSPSEKRAPIVSIASIVGALLLLVAVAGFYGHPRGVIPESMTRSTDWVLAHGFAPAITLILGLLGVAALGAAILRSPKSSEKSTALERGLAAALLGAAVITAFAMRDASWTTATRPAGQERLIQLFVYLYTRPFPEHLDYRPIFSAVAVVATLGTALLAFRRARSVGVRVLLASALSLSIFATNVYLPDLAEHWSSHGLVDRYYSLRKPGEELIAFQMNWKGENFYTGNRVSTYVDLDTSKLRSHLASSSGKTIYAVLEHSRVESLRNLMPAGSELDPMTTKRLNNKFVLVRMRIAAGS